MTPRRPTAALRRAAGLLSAAVLAMGACTDEPTTPPPSPAGEGPEQTPEAQVVEFTRGSATLSFSGDLEGEVELPLGGEVDSELDLVGWTLDLGYAAEASVDPEVPPVTALIVQGPVVLGPAPHGRALAIGIVLLGPDGEPFDAGDEEATCTTDFRRLDESGVDADLECVGLTDEAGDLFDVSGSFTAEP